MRMGVCGENSTSISSLSRLAIVPPNLDLRKLPIVVAVPIL